MTGFDVKIIPREEVPVSIRFRLYDNDELVVDNIGALDFRYITPEDYVGQHDLFVTYFDVDHVDVESEKRLAYANFILPILDYEVTVVVF